MPLLPCPFHNALFVRKGPIPRELGHLTALKHLHLCNNGLTGERNGFRAERMRCCVLGGSTGSISCAPPPRGGEEVVIFFFWWHACPTGCRYWPISSVSSISSVPLLLSHSKQHVLVGIHEEGGASLTSFAPVVACSYRRHPGGAGAPYQVGVPSAEQQQTSR